MSSTILSTAPERARRAANGHLDIDPEAFRINFDRKPFRIDHHLADHPLFALPRLLQLARQLPEENVEYNAGDIPISLNPELTPRTGLSIEETIRRIEDCRSWMVLKYVEHDADYRALLQSCLDEVKVHSEPLVPGMCQEQGFIFITSPRSVTPYHMDPEHNFLLQVRGSKTINLFDRAVVSAQELESFYAGSHRNMEFREEYRARCQAFELQPGMGLHFPATAPHFVHNGPEVSISFSITFRTPDLDRRSMVHNVNGFMRRRGLRPAPVGRRPWGDALKCFAYRVARRARHVFGKKT